jgi:hypothetical protein
MGTIRFGADQIHHRFRLGQVQPTIEERTLGEFAGLGQSRAALQTESQNLAGGQDTAVTIYFDSVFLRVCAGRAHDSEHNLVDDMAIRADAPKVQRMRGEFGRQTTARRKSAIGNIKGTRAGNANDGDTAFTNRSGNGRDCVFHELASTPKTFGARLQTGREYSRREPDFNECGTTVGPTILRVGEDAAGIPTGIAPDIHRQVELRKAKRAAAPDNLA